jgi:hypothetical protein
MRWRAFAQVRHGSNIQLLPYPLVMAANAYSAGDLFTGHMYEVRAYEYIRLGQACEE